MRFYAGEFFTYCKGSDKIIPDTIFYVCDDDKYQYVNYTNGKSKANYNPLPIMDRPVILSDLMCIKDMDNIHINNLLVYLLKKYQVEIVPTT